MKNTFILTIILYFIHLSYLAGQDKIVVKNVYFFGHLDYTEDVQICEKSVWVNVLNEHADMCQCLNFIKKSLPHAESSKLESVRIGESTHEVYEGTIGVGEVGEFQHMIIYDPNIFIRGEEKYVSDKKLFKYLILAHEIAHVFFSHTNTCIYNIENETFRNYENDADYHCGIILAQLQFERLNLEGLLNNSIFERFLRGRNYNSIKERKLSILKGFNHGIESANKLSNLDCDCSCPPQF